MCGLFSVPLIAKRHCMAKNVCINCFPCSVLQVADIGTLQRLPRIVGDQRAAELTYTARTFSGSEAQRMGLVPECFDSEEDMMTHVKKVAADIAAKSPITTRYAVSCSWVAAFLILCSLQHCDQNLIVVSSQHFSRQ